MPTCAYNIVDVPYSQRAPSGVGAVRATLGRVRHTTECCHLELRSSEAGPFNRRTRHVVVRAGASTCHPYIGTQRDDEQQLMHSHDETVSMTSRLSRACLSALVDAL